MEGRALRPYPPVVVDFGGDGIAPASFVNLTPIVVQWKRRDRRKQIISLPGDPDEAVESGTEFCVRHGPPGFETTTVLGTDADTSGDFNLDFKGYSRVEFFARRDGYESTAFAFDTVAENGAGASVSGLLGSVTLSGAVEGSVTVIVERPLPTIDVQFTEPVEVEAELPAAVTITPIDGAVDTVTEITENFIIGVSSLLEATIDISVEGSGSIGTVTATVPAVTLEAGADKVAGGGIYAFPAIVTGEVIGSAEGEIVEPSSSMATPIWAGNSRIAPTMILATASATRYFSPAGQHLPYADFAYTFYTSEGTWRKPVGADGTLDKFGINIAANDRTTDTTFTLVVNGVDTTQTLTVAGGATGWFNTTGDPVTVAAGDLLSVKVVTGAGGQNLSIASTRVAFEADDGVVMHHQLQGDLAINMPVSTNARGAPLHGQIEGNSFAEKWDTSPASQNGYDARIQTDGVASRLVIFVRDNTHTTDLEFTLYVNDAATDLSVTVPAGTTGQFSNIVDEVSLAAGDRASYRVKNVATGSGAMRIGWAQLIVTRDVAAYDVYCAQTASDTLQGYSGSTYYMGVNVIFPETTDDALSSFTKLALPVGGVVSNFWVRYNHANNNATYNYTMRKNGANTALSVLAPAANGGGTLIDTTNEVTFADGDRPSVGFQTSSFSQWPQAWGFTVSAA